MSIVRRAVAWWWDNLPGGVPMQLVAWRVSPRLANFAEESAWARDRGEL